MQRSRNTKVCMPSGVSCSFLWATLKNEGTRKKCHSYWAVPCKNWVVLFILSLLSGLWDIFFFHWCPYFIGMLPYGCFLRKLPRRNRARVRNRESLCRRSMTTALLSYWESRTLDFANLNFKALFRDLPKPSSLVSWSQICLLNFIAVFETVRSYQ